MAQPIVISMASGADQSIDARIAPNGTVSRAENLRLDTLGRLVPRAGYSALGMRVSRNATPLVPIDLYDLDGKLVALGRHGAGNTGARQLYEQTNGPDFEWWFLDNQQASNPGSATTETIMPLTRAAEIVYADPAAGARGEENIADCAVSANGYVCHAQSNSDAVLVPRTSVMILDPSGSPVHRVQFSSQRNVRVIAVGNTFVMFHQFVATIVARTFVAGTSTDWTTTTSIAVNATPNNESAYSVTDIAGNTTEYLICWPTATGFTWERKNLAHATQATVNVASLATNGVVDIEGNQSENSVWVLNKVAGNGAEIRRWSLAGALLTGPFANDPFGAPVDAVYIKRGFGANICLFVQELSGTYRGAWTGLVRDTLALNVGPSQWSQMRAAGRPHMVMDRPFGIVQLAVNGSPGSQCMGLWGYGNNNSSFSAQTLQAPLMMGRGSPVPTKLINWKATTKLAVGASTQYAEVNALDTRSDTTRNHLYKFTIGDENRRQAAVINGSLYLSGGSLIAYASGLAMRAGFAHSPVITLLAASVGGGLTLLGAYQYAAVYRITLADGRVIQSPPSDVVSITLTGGNNRVTATVVHPMDATLLRWYVQVNAVVFIDLYRTEAGGSIPRLVSSTELGLISTPPGGPQTIVDDATDAAQQLGNTVYTQGADGVVSGRLPLSTAEGCEFITESGGRLFMGRMETPTALEISHDNRPGEAVGFSNDDLFFLTSPERVSGVASDGQRKFVFTGKRTYEVVGEGPNSAGIGEISDPMELDPTVGCEDWRSICETEMGVFFQPSGTARPGYALLPSAGGRAIDVGREIGDTLHDFPVIVAATRHAEQDLLTLCLQSADGLDSRLAHLDMRQSGLGPRGWRGRWFVDRVPFLEGERAPEVVASTRHDFSMVALSGTVPITIPIPEGRQLNDRVVVVLHTQGVQNSAPPGYLTLVNIFTSSGVSVFRVYERILTNAAGVLASTLTTFPNNGIPSAMSFRVFLIRGGDPGTVAQASTSAVTGASPSSPVVNPVWGTAKDLWLTACAIDTGTPATLANVAANNLSLVGVPPTGYDRVESSVIYGGANLTTDTGELVTAWKQARQANDQVTWGLRASSTNAVLLLVIKPNAATGTPARAAVSHQQKLHLANATTVYRADSTAVTDAGGSQIRTLWDTSTIYPMGPGGAGRHIGVTFVGELLGFCTLTCSFSYDDGRTWQTGRTHHLSPANGYQIGQTVRVHWTPFRRKIEGVRIRIESSSEDGITNPATGTTRGVAHNQVTLWFDGLLGKSRVAQSRSF